MADTRLSILENAKKLISKQGYTATSIRQIAEKTGIGKATIYHHFHDKKAIMLALLKENTDGIRDVLQKARSETDPLLCIEAVANGIIHFFYRNMEMIQIARRELPGARENLQSDSISVIKEYKAILEEAIRKGSERGIFRVVDPAEAANTLMALIQGTFVSVLLSGEITGSHENTIASYLDIFYNGIKK